MLEHIALIPDGNRRWARKHKLPIRKGHEKGCEVLENLVKSCLSKEGKYKDIKEFTAFALSTENFRRRPRWEIAYLMILYERLFDKMARSKAIHEYEVRMRVIGRRDLLPKKVREAVERAEEMTAGYDKRFLNIALIYGGREEIVCAIQKIAQKVKRGMLGIKDINEELFSKCLYTESAPDLVIRTAERRLSNFLLWQCAYSEIYFCDKLFPEFTKEDLDAAILDYRQRERHFGK